MNDRARIGRRRFVRLAAVAAAAAAMNPIAAAPAPAAPPSPKKTRARARARTPDPAVRAEIENQKKQLDAMLQVIRSYELPAGSPPAMVFRPLAPRRRA